MQEFIFTTKTSRIWRDRRRTRRIMIVILLVLFVPLWFYYTVADTIPEDILIGLQEENQDKQLQALDKLIDYQSITPSLSAVKLIFSLYSDGSQATRQRRGLEHLQGSPQATRQTIEKSISRIKITDEIIQWLKEDGMVSPNPQIRLLTLRLIGNHSIASLTSTFSRFTYDPDAHIRLENIKYLAKIYDESVMPVLAVTLTDSYYPVRKLSLEALRRYLPLPDVIDIIMKRYPVESSMTLQFEMEEAIVSAFNQSENINLILNYLNLDSPEIRALVSRVIGKSSVINDLDSAGKEEYIKVLEGLRDGGNIDVITSKEWALKQLKGKGNESSKVEDIKLSGKSLIASLRDRFEPGKKEALLKYGGSEETEEAVKLGLEWLRRNQESNGSWNCVRHNPWHGHSPMPLFTNEDELVDVAVTGLSLLCFLASGSTHQYGPYKDVIVKGLEYIIAAQDKTGLINIPKGHIHNERCLDHGIDHGNLPRRYNHNISTLVLVETYAMTGDSDIKDKAQRALEHSKNTPEPQFLWSFYLEPSDVGPSIFYILALKIAQQTDLIVSPKEIEKVKIYLNRLTDKTSGRIIHLCPIPICFGGMDSTASGLFGHILMKSDPAIITKGADWLKQFQPQWEPFYQYNDYYPNLLFLENNIMNEWHWYYQTLAFRQLGGDYWTEWNKKHKDVLLKHQRQGGLWDGSWDPEGPWATIGGRVYSTAFSILSLEAYYSYSFKD